MLHKESVVNEVKFQLEVSYSL